MSCSEVIAIARLRNVTVVGIRRLGAGVLVAALIALALLVTGLAAVVAVSRWLCSLAFSKIAAWVRGVVFPFSGLLVLLGVIVLLGRVFHKIQPWFGVGASAVLLSFGAFSLAYGHRRGLRFLASYKVKPRATFDLTAGLLAVVGAVVALGSATIPRSALPYWIGSVLVVGGLTTLVLGVKWLFGSELAQLAAVWRSEQALAELLAADEEGSHIEDAAFDSALLIGVGVVGVAYVSIFFPLTVWWSRAHNLDVVDVLLFTNIGDVFEEHGFVGGIRPYFDLFSDPSHIFAWGTFYGMVGLAVGLILIVVYQRRGHLGELAILSWGLLAGYWLTILIKNILGGAGDQPLLLTAGGGFMYVLVLHYGLWALENTVPKWGLEAKWRYLVAGMQTVGSAWIVSRAFGDQAVVFSGVTFFASVFLMTSAFELVFGRLAKVVDSLHSASSPIVPNMLEMLRKGDSSIRAEVTIVIVMNAVFPPLAFGILKLVSLGL